MGAFLAALGAVLLFVLKAVGILLLVVLVLVVLLLLCPFCADLCWEHGVLTVRAGALGITFPVFQYPKPEPPPAPENPEPPKGFGKVKAKFAAWRAERKRKKAEEKARKKAVADKPARPRKKAKITLEIICTMLRGAGRLMKAVFGALRITKIQVRLGVRGEDPAAAARDYGKLQAWLYPVLGVLDRFLWLQFDELRILPHIVHNTRLTDNIHTYLVRILIRLTGYKTLDQCTKTLQLCMSTFVDVQSIGQRFTKR